MSFVCSLEQSVYVLFDSVRMYFNHYQNLRSSVLKGTFGPNISERYYISQVKLSLCLLYKFKLDWCWLANCLKLLLSLMGVVGVNKLANCLAYLINYSWELKFKHETSSPGLL